MAGEIIKLGKNVAVYGAGSVIIKFIEFIFAPFLQVNCPQKNMEY